MCLINWITFPPLGDERGSLVALEAEKTLLPDFDSSQDLRLLLVGKSRKESQCGFNEERFVKIKVEYREPCWQEMESAKLLRDTLYKVRSISELLKKLKEGGVDWEPNHNDVEELKKLALSS